ncbi:hypothetical protein [Vibrio brasiliensis]
MTSTPAWTSGHWFNLFFQSTLLKYQPTIHLLNWQFAAGTDLR